MQMFLHFYPAILTMLSMYCYKRDNRWMQKFYRRMALSISARKFFVLMLILLSLSFNFCYLQSFGVDAVLGISSLLCLIMFSFRISEKGFYRMHTRGGIGLIFVAMLACVLKPAIWPLSMNLFIFTLGSMFYPSQALMRQLKDPETFTKYAANPATMIPGYYSR